MNPQDPLPPNVPSTPWTEVDILKSFCFHELETATRNFCTDSLVGKSAFCSSTVFMGWIDEHSLTATKPNTGMAVAIRRFFREPRTLQNHMEWLTEVNSLAQLCHSNLVKLIGYCLENDHRLLVYEFMSHGSLDGHLFRRGSSLSRNLRMKIALGAAKGLAFLHGDEAKVIYGDFSSSKILLDSSYNAKLSGYGLANEGFQGYRRHFSKVRAIATNGYAAPECVAFDLDIMDGFYSYARADPHGKDQSDVYSFGVVLLEMLTSRPAVDWNRPTEECILVEWAEPYLASKGKVLRILDACLEGQYTKRGARTALDIAIQCLSIEPSSRPNMNEVVKALEKLQETGDIGGPGNLSK